MCYFTTNRSLFLVPSNLCEEEFKKIDLFMDILNESEVGRLLEYESKLHNDSSHGRKGYNIYHLFAAVIYCFSKSKNSLREIQEACLFDLRVIYIMEQETPSYKILGEFINRYIVPYQYEIFTCITQTIIKHFKLDVSDQYLDGTKIEANANKYKFVWKPIKYHENLNKKISDVLSEINCILDDNQIKSYTLYKIMIQYATKEHLTLSKIPNKKGKRLTPQQKNLKLLHEYLIKLIEYERKEAICGDNRNSYYKTDHDATAMALKTDYYSGHGSNMHAAYNVQILVSSGLVTMYGVYQDRTDYHTLKSMNDLYFKYYGTYPINECADSGYGIYENYQYLLENNINNYVKFQQWNGERSGKRPQIFFSFPEGIICLGANIGEVIPYNNNRHQKKQGNKLYKFSGCDRCNYVYKCKSKLKKENQEKNYRIIELNLEYELFKEDARENLMSPKGIEIRVNRSIQVEGIFGQIKQNMQYDRIRRRSIKKVSAEIMLISLGKNIRKIFTMFGKKEIPSKYWVASEDLKKEEIKYPKQKKTERN